MKFLWHDKDPSLFKDWRCRATLERWPDVSIWLKYSQVPWDIITENQSFNQSLVLCYSTFSLWYLNVMEKSLDARFASLVDWLPNVLHSLRKSFTHLETWRAAKFRLAAITLLSRIFRSPNLKLLRWPIAMGGRPSSCVVRHTLASFQELMGQSLPNLVCSIIRIRRKEIVNFTPPPALSGDTFGEKGVKLMYFSKKNLTLYSRALIKLSFLWRWLRKGLPKWLMSWPGQWSCALIWHGHISHISHYLLLYQYKALW